MPGQMYFPIFFSEFMSLDGPCREKMQSHDNEMGEYPYREPAFFIDECNGFWRFFSYGMVGTYYKDFKRMKGFNEAIKDWGKEDLDFVNDALQQKIQVFKAVDHSLFHVYHDKTCKGINNDEQHQMCVNTRSGHYGSFLSLYQTWK